MGAGRQDRAVLLAHPGGGRAGLRHRTGDRGGPAGRLRRLPDHPPADDRPAARVRHLVHRRPAAGGRADGRGLGRRARRRARPGCPYGPATTAPSPGRCRASPSPRAYGYASCAPPTSPWKVSSPTWWRNDNHEPDRRQHHAARPVRPQAGAAAAAGSGADDRPDGARQRRSPTAEPTGSSRWSVGSASPSWCRSSRSSSARRCSAPRSTTARIVHILTKPLSRSRDHPRQAGRRGGRGGAGQRLDDVRLRRDRGVRPVRRRPRARRGGRRRSATARCS